MTDREDPDVREVQYVNKAFELWRDRFVINGVEYYDLRRLERRIDTWGEWCESFEGIGDEHVELGEAAVERGDEAAAGKHFVQASKYFHFGSFVWHENEPKRESVHAKSVETYRRGGEYLEPALERIEVPYEGPEGTVEVPGNLRVPDRAPAGVEGSPLVVLYPGLDSTKEEMTLYEPYLHERGLATLAIEGPGQGEMWEQHRMTPEYPAFVSAVIDHLEDQSPEGVDVSRLGGLGQSLGGFYSPYVAAHDERFDACIGFSGPFTVGPVSRWGFGVEVEQFKHACKTDSLIESDEIAEALTLRDVIEDLTCPSLMITGGRDEIVPAVQTERIAERAPNGEYLVFEEGIHVCRNIPHKCLPRSADWLRTELTP